MEIKNEGRGTIFNNAFLEVFTKAPAPVSFGFYFVVMGTLVGISIQKGVVDTFWKGALIYLGALFFWTFFEYVFHRFINHLDYYFPESPTIRRIDYVLHGIHHEYPRDPARLIMPPLPGLIIVSILFGGYYLILGNYAFLFLAGFLNGYLLYTLIHYGTHRFKPPKLLKPLWRHHALHHYKHTDRAFGVSSTFWDHIFRTMPPEKKQRKKEKHEVPVG